MPPFIIWTQRRTGGTTLANLLVTCSGLSAWPDEALNQDRELGSISTHYDATGDEAALDARLGPVLAQRRALKHCVETVPWGVSRALLRRSRDHGYRHVLLLRGNETERQLSLALAEMTGAWGPEEARARYRGLMAGTETLPPIDLPALRTRLYADAVGLGRLMRALACARTGHATVLYEDLFTGEEPGRYRHFNGLAEYLGVPSPPPGDATLHSALMGRSQHTHGIYRCVPNLAEAVALIESMI